MLETFPSSINTYKKIVHDRNSEELGWKDRWNEAQLGLFHDDFHRTLEQAGFTVREWQEGDPKGYANGKPQAIATQPCGDASEILVAYAAREPNNSNVQFYSLRNGEQATEEGNHDMTASEFLVNLLCLLDRHSVSLSEQFESSEEVGRMRNWTRYNEIDA